MHRRKLLRSAKGRAAGRNPGCQVPREALFLCGTAPEALRRLYSCIVSRLGQVVHRLHRLSLLTNVEDPCVKLETSVEVESYSIGNSVRM